MASKLETLKANLEAAFGGRLVSVTEAIGELTIVVKASEYLDVVKRLRDDPTLRFEQLMDLCGVDYQTYGDGAYEGPRFAAVLHLLSVANNWRLRVRAFAPDDEVPILASVVDIWSSDVCSSDLCANTRTRRRQLFATDSRCSTAAKRGPSYAPSP